MKFTARVAAVAAVALATAGCSTINPITTQQAYDASDGVSVEIGEVTALNLLVVTEGEGEPAVLLGSLHNPSAEDVTVTVSVDGTETVDVDVPAGATVKLGGEEGEAHVTGTATAAPGLLSTVLFSTDASGQVTRETPVLDATLEEYAAELETLS